MKVLKNSKKKRILRALQEPICLEFGVKEEQHKLVRKICKNYKKALKGKIDRNKYLYLVLKHSRVDSVKSFV